MTLKTEHDAIISRLPLSRSQSPDPSVSPPASPAYPSQSLPSFSSSFSDLGSPLPKRLFQSPRRITISPDDIAYLTEQNQELLGKLEKLEEESAQADLAGKRKLRKLEKEIQGMREELERTQLRSAELEERTRKLLDKDVDTRRQERKDRYNELRTRTDLTPVASPEVRDFSPGGALSSAAPRPVERLPSWPIVAEAPSAELLVEENLHASAIPPTSSERVSGDHVPLITQLLSKIHELEDINAQMSRQQANTTSRLASAQRDSDNIKKLYDVLRDESDTQLEIIIEDVDAYDPSADTNASTPSSIISGLELPKIIRFKSLRKSIENMSDDLDDNFAEGIQDDMRSTNRGAPPDGASQTRKLRKTIIGLFDESPGSDSNPSSPTLPDLSFHSFDSSLPGSPSIPSLSLDLSTPRVESPVSHYGEGRTWLPSSEPPSAELSCRALSNELGAELGGGDIWGVSENHHLRRSSLANISALSLPYSPTDVSASLPGAFEPAASLSTRSSGGSIRVGMAGAIPPFPSLSSMSSSIINSSATSLTPSIRLDHSLRARRLSAAMLSRSERWKEARASHWAAGSLQPKQLVKKNSALGITSIFEAAVDAMNMGPSGASPTDETADGGVDSGDEAFEDADDSALEVRPTLGPVTQKREKMGLVQVVLEVWLWLQFVIIVVVFCKST
jgi:hypothetical protein